MHAHDTWRLQVEFNLFAVSSTARKAHRNGIKRPKSNRYESLKGVCKRGHFSTWHFVHPKTEVAECVMHYKSSMLNKIYSK